MTVLLTLSMAIGSRFGHMAFQGILLCTLGSRLQPSPPFPKCYHIPTFSFLFITCPSLLVCPCLSMETNSSWIQCEMISIHLHHWLLLTVLLVWYFFILYFALMLQNPLFRSVSGLTLLALSLLQTSARFQLFPPAHSISIDRQRHLYKLLRSLCFS